MNLTLILMIVAAGAALALALLCLRLTASARALQAERDTARAEAARQEVRVNHLLEASPVALAETDARGLFVFANAAAHELVGRKDREMLGLGFHAATWGIAYPDGRPIPQDLLPISRALRGQTVKNFEHQIVHHRSREKRSITVTARPILDERGQVTGVIASMVPSELVQA